MAELRGLYYNNEDFRRVSGTPTDGIEIHPYAPFVPPTASVLILGSFPGIDQTRRSNESEEWYYSAKRNQLWQILEAVYDVKLKSVTDKKELFNEVGIAITDIILKARRLDESNLDKHLVIVEYNTDAVEQIIKLERIKKVLFTSQFVQKHFVKIFPQYLNGECLPSPSPRYAKMSKTDKIEAYKRKLPKK